MNAVARQGAIPEPAEHQRIGRLALRRVEVGHRKIVAADFLLLIEFHMLAFAGTFQGAGTCKPETSWNSSAIFAGSRRFSVILLSPAFWADRRPLRPSSHAHGGHNCLFGV